MQDRLTTALVAMRRILRATETSARALARETGLTTPQLMVLEHLRDGAESTPTRIAQSVGVAQATATALIEKLEARGMVLRRRGESDRRQYWLSLTETGAAALDASPDPLQRRFAERFAKLDDWEKAMLVASLERVAHMLAPDTADALVAALESDEIEMKDAALDELGERCRAGSSGRVSRAPRLSFRAADDGRSGRMSFHYTRLALSPAGVALWVLGFSWFYAVHVFDGNWAKAFYYTIQAGLSIGFGVLPGGGTPASLLMTTLNVFIGAGFVAKCLASYTAHLCETREKRGGRALDRNFDRASVATRVVAYQKRHVSL